MKDSPCLDTGFAGATGVVVNDSHGSMRNIDPDDLHPKAILISGDAAVCRQTNDVLGRDVTTVQVKEAYGRLAAKLVPMAEARRMIKGGVKEALAKLGRAKPFKRRRIPSSSSITSRPRPIWARCFCQASSGWTPGL